MQLVSSAFDHLAPLDPRFGCEGADTSPPLSWSAVPLATRSFALIVEDPDAPDPAAPKRIWVHWVLFDIPASLRELAEGAATRLPAGVSEGSNDWKQLGYRGPCPPIGRHRYVHRLYALDVEQLELDRPTRAELLAAIEGHVLASAELIGTYARRRA